MSLRTRIDRLEDESRNRGDIVVVLRSRDGRLSRAGDGRQYEPRRYDTVVEIGGGHLTTEDVRALWHNFPAPTAESDV
jgi:hypothetical protein